MVSRDTRGTALSDRAAGPTTAPRPAARLRAARLTIDDIAVDCYLTDERRTGPIVVAIPPMWVPAQVMMLDVLAALQPIATGVTVDAPCVAGSGDPPTDSPRYFVDRYGSVVGAMSRFYLAALDGLGLDARRRPLVIIGHCGGAWIACDLVRRGLRPRRLLLSTIPPWTNDLISTFGRGIVTDRGDGAWVYDLPGYQRLRPGVGVTQADVDKANTRALRVRPLRHRPFLDADVDSLGQNIPSDARTLDRCRTVLLHPEHDLISYDERRRMAAELTAELIVLKGEAHDPTRASLPVWCEAFARLAREALVDDLVGGAIDG